MPLISAPSGRGRERGWEREGGERERDISLRSATAKDDSVRL